MIKKTAKIITLILLIACMCLPLCGCWDYVGLNEVGLVLGVAIDKSDEGYKITCEIVDLASSTKDTGPMPAYIECYGKTVFDAVRNSKSRSATKTFFGNIEIIIISEEMAKDVGLYKILDLFLRDAEPRETIKLLVSEGTTAEELLTAQGLTSRLNATEIKQIIAKDHKVTSKTGDIELYQAYNVLFGKGRELVLPAFHIIKNKDQTTTESNGVALFKKDKLIGYLSPDDTMFYLFVINEVNGGTLVVREDDNVLTTFEINKSETKMDYKYDEKKDQFKIILEINCDVFIGECTLQHEIHNEELIKKDQDTANNYLKNQIQSVIKKVQDEYDTDIFGFGNLIYRKDAKLWEKVSKDWDRYFKELEVEIKPNIQIRNTAVLRT